MVASPRFCLFCVLLCTSNPKLATQQLLRSTSGPQSAVGWGSEMVVASMLRSYGEGGLSAEDLVMEELRDKHEDQHAVAGDPGETGSA